ncbi:MAG: hypothetical protein ACOC0E_03570 [Spirochaetota bacterium]
MPTDPLQHLSIGGLRSLEALVADSSSIIFANKAGFLLPLVQTVKLTAPPGVFREIGDEIPAEAGLSGVRHIDDVETLYKGFSVDAQVVVAAKQLNIPILSDDLKLLGRAAESEIAGFTARTMLELLLLLEKIDLETYNRFKRALSGLVRYALPLYVAAEELHWQIRKEIG